MKLYYKIIREKIKIKMTSHYYFNRCNYNYFKKKPINKEKLTCQLDHLLQVK